MNMKMRIERRLARERSVHYLIAVIAFVSAIQGQEQQNVATSGEDTAFIGYANVSSSWAETRLPAFSAVGTSGKIQPLEVSGNVPADLPIFVTPLPSAREFISGTTIEVPSSEEFIISMEEVRLRFDTMFPVHSVEPSPIEWSAPDDNANAGHTYPSEPPLPPFPMISQDATLAKSLSVANITSVPEPSVLNLTALGTLLGAACIYRRRKTKSERA